MRSTKPLMEPEPEFRDCLKCRRPFPSDGPHNRLCFKCNEENSRLGRFASQTPLEENARRLESPKILRDSDRDD